MAGRNRGDYARVENHPIYGYVTKGTDLQRIAERARSEADDASTIDRVFESVSTTVIQTTMRMAVAQLPEIDAKVLTLRYGLFDGSPQPLFAVADELGLSREECFAIEQRAIRQLDTKELRQALAG